jgi:hypothetical protein
MTEQNGPPSVPPPVLGYSSAVTCPRCGSPNSRPVSYTWWGGVIGPKLLHHVKCLECKCAYNGKTGQLNTKGITIYTVILIAIVLVLVVVFRHF